MKSSSKPWLLLAILAILSPLTMSGCEEYFPPPEAQLVRSGTGAYTLGEPLALSFSAPVVEESFQLKVWPVSRGTRRVPEAEVEPLVGPCSLGESCDGLEISFEDDGKKALLQFDNTLAGPGATFVLEVLPGLTDRDGHITGASYLYTVRFRATAGDPNANIQFDNGVYVLGGSVNHPMRAVLTLVTHIQILPDGRFAMAGAKGDVVDDDVPDTSRDPEVIEIDTTENGWTLFATGLVVEDAEGNRFLETEVFDVEIPVLGGSLFLEMKDVRLFADITKDGDGNDFIDGTLTYEEIVLINMSNGNRSSYDGDSTELLGDFVAPALVPTGTPDMCDNICGAVTGICSPPENFPDADFCE